LKPYSSTSFLLASSAFFLCLRFLHKNIPASTSKATTTTGTTTATAVLPPTDSPPPVVDLEFCDWSVAGSDVDEDFEDCVDEGTTTAADVSEGCVVIVTMTVLGVPPGVDADSVMTEVMMCVDGGIEAAATDEVTTLADDGGGFDDGGGVDDGAGVEASEERETGVELGGEEDVTAAEEVMVKMEDEDTEGSVEDAVKESKEVVGLLAVPLLLAAMSNKAEQRSYKKECVRLGLDRSRLTVPDQNST